METLPYEILIKTAVNLDYDNILNNCRINKLWNALCKDDDFWRQKAWFDFGIEPAQFNQTISNRQQRYLQIYSRFDIGRGSEKFKALNKCLHDAVKQGNMKKVKYFIFKGANDIEKGLYNSARYGHSDLVDYFLSLGALSVHKALVKAYRYGHLGIYIDLFTLRRIPDYDRYTYMQLCLAAVKKRHAGDLEMFLTLYRQSKKIPEYLGVPEDDWFESILSELVFGYGIVARVGMPKITEVMGIILMWRIRIGDLQFVRDNISDYIRDEPFYLNVANVIVATAEENQKETFNLILDEMVSQEKDLSEEYWDLVLQSLFWNNQMDLVEILKDKFNIKVDHTSLNLFYLLRYRFYDEFKREFLKIEAYKERRSMDILLFKIIDSGSLELFEFILQYPFLFTEDLDFKYHKVTSTGFLDMVVKLDQSSPINTNRDRLIYDGIYSENLGNIKTLITQYNCLPLSDISGIDKNLDPNFSQEVIEYIDDVRSLSE